MFLFYFVISLFILYLFINCAVSECLVITFLICTTDTYYGPINPWICRTTERQYRRLTLLALELYEPYEYKVVKLQDRSPFRVFRTTSYYIPTTPIEIRQIIQLPTLKKKLLDSMKEWHTKYGKVRATRCFSAGP